MRNFVCDLRTHRNENICFFCDVETPSKQALTHFEAQATEKSWFYLPVAKCCFTVRSWLDVDLNLTNMSNSC